MKKTQQILSLRDIRSMHSTGARSIPRIQRSSYLELYTLKREKDRLEKEVFVLNKRKSSAGRQMDSINKRMEGLQKEVHQEKKIKTYRSIPTKPLKTMAINY